MADTNTNGNGWKTVGIIALILGGIYLFTSLIKGTFNISKWFAPATPPAPTQTEFEKCVKANKAKADGTPCSNCVAEGSGEPNFNGVIRDGVCTRVAQSASTTIQLRKIKVKATGATVYSYVGNNFVALANAAKIPATTELTVLQIATSNGTYYNTAMGWVSANDVDVMM